MDTNSRIATNRRTLERPKRFPATWIFAPPLLWAVLLLFSLPMAVQAAGKDFPAPDWLDKVTVSDRMIINGLSSSVQYFEASRNMEELLRFYRRQWNDGKAARPGYRETTVEPWHIISRLHGRYLYTVQVQKDGPFIIKGYLAVADLKASRQENTMEHKAPKMRGSRIFNQSTTFDPGRTGHTLMIVNDFSIASNTEYYRNHYQERGWTKLVDMENDHARVLSFKKHARKTHLVIQQTGGATQIVMNLVEHN